MGKTRIPSELKSTLWKKDNYLDRTVDDLINYNIIEYDIREAGFNLIIKYGLLDERKIKYLHGLTKKLRSIAIGQMVRDDKKFGRQLMLAFKWARKKFFKSNGLTNEDIISVKKDAIFVKGKICTNLEFGNVVFVHKNTYTSYHRLNGNEFYYNSQTDKLDVKGINDGKLGLHENYMLSVLKWVFKSLEMGDKTVFIPAYRKFIMEYCDRKLNVEYYRRLTGDNLFTFYEEAGYKFSDYYDVGLRTCEPSDFEYLDISYNYINYLLPIMQRHYFLDLRVKDKKKNWKKNKR